MSNVEDAVEQFVFVGMLEAGDELLEAKQRLQLPLDPLLQRHGVQILLHHDHAETPQPRIVIVQRVNSANLVHA